MRSPRSSDVGLPVPRGSAGAEGAGATGGPCLPLHRGAASPVSIRRGRVRCAGELWAAASTIAPGGSAVINLCQDRFAFLAGLAAALSRRQTTLLPPSGAPAVIAEMRTAYGDCRVLDDSQLSHLPRTDAAGSRPTLPEVDFIAVTGHTSGSTGSPAVHHKRLPALKATTTLNAGAIRRLLPASASGETPWIVATVPSQHMYGFELAALMPLLAGFAIHAAHPLLPADVASALAEVPAPRILVSTPVHLRSLLGSGVALPPVEVVVSATAPLSRELAGEVESAFGTQVLEMFGSTETCVFATRRTSLEEAWSPYPGIGLAPQAAGTLVTAPWMPEATLLQDILEVWPDGRFTVVGRNTDMVDVAGKRASLADLNRRLVALPGVRDGFIFMPEASGSGAVRRLAALVVAPDMTESQVIELLRREVDPLFLPRPLVLVDALPRNDVGKLPRKLALELLASAAAHRHQHPAGTG